MKKLFLVLLGSLLILTGCGSKTEGEVEKPAESTTYKVGTGVYSTTSTTEPAEGKTGKFEANVTYAAVVLEGDKIKFVSIDTAQNKVDIAEDGTATFTAKDTKKELGDAYGMAKDGKLEWYEQIAEIEKWMVGKTLSEIATMEGSDVSSSVSIKTPSYIEAVTRAINAAVEVKDVVKVGVASTTSGKAEEGKLEINTVISTVAFDKDGKSLNTFIDQAQLKATLEGTVATASEEVRTKGEQKEDYGMSKNGNVEWYKQVETLTAWSVGKTIEEIMGAKDVADVTSSVSITIDGLLSTVKKASDVAVAL